MDGEGSKSRRGPLVIDMPRLDAPVVHGLLRRTGHIARRVFLFELPRALPEAEAGSRAAPKPRRLPSLYLLSFIALVVIPSLAAQFYLAFLASDQYVAETRFAVRAAEADSGDAIKSALSSIGGLGIPSMTGQDAFIVTSYIHSRTIIDDLRPLVNVAAIYRRPEADFWARLKDHAKAEDVLGYWNSMVSTNVDGPSGIVTVKIRAFRPEDALALSNAVIKLSEKLANDISEHARRDVMRRAELEVRRADARVRGVLDEMRAYREKEGFLNPVTQAQSTSKLLMKALAEKIQLENELFVDTRAMSATAPTVAALKTRLEAVNQQVDRLKDQLTGRSDAKSISASLVRFEELELKRQFAEKLYSLAQESLERARQRAEAQAVYLSVFVPPSLPQEAEFPKRIGSAFIVVVTFTLLWAAGALLVAAVNDHLI